MFTGRKYWKYTVEKGWNNMKKYFNSLLSYTLSVVSGLFLVSGIAVLSAER